MGIPYKRSLKAAPQDFFMAFWPGNSPYGLLGLTKINKLSISKPWGSAGVSTVQSPPKENLLATRSRVTNPFRLLPQVGQAAKIAQKF